MEAYRIADEPKPGTLAHLVVQPFWPFFAVMFGGAWISWPWFIFNGIAMGSPTLRREILIAAGGVVGSAVLVFGIVFLAHQGILDSDYLKYALLLVTIWKLGITYFLYAAQSATFEIYTYYGGLVKNGFMIVILAYFLRARLVPAISENFGQLWALVLA